MKKEDFLSICRSKAKTALTADEESFLGSIGEAIEKAFENDSVERNKQLKTVTDQLGTIAEGETLSAIVRTLATKVDEFEAKAKRGLSGDDKFMLKKMLEDKKDEIVRAKDSGKPWQIEFRAKRGASALMTAANVLTGAVAINNVNVMDDLEVMVIQYPKNFVVDAIGGRQVAKIPAVLRWKEQTTESTNATGLTAEGNAKPLTDKLFVWKTANRAKYAGRIEFTEELTMDFDQLLLQIIDMFEQQVIRSWNAAVQVALFAYGSAYTSTGLDGTFINPSIWQVIKAAKLWVMNQNYEPDLVFISPDNAALAGYIEDKNGAIQFLPDAVAFSGLTPIITTNVGADVIVVGSSQTVKEQHSAFIIRRGMHGDQFIENEETIVGEVFSLLKLPTVSKASWITVSIAAIKEALTIVNN